MTTDSFPRPAPSFDDPLAMLRACHERILAQCATLRQLLDHIQAQGVDQAAREASAQVVRYFSTAARDHHQDEERDLFPLLRAAGGASTDVLARLEQDHEAMETTWTELEDLLRHRLESLPAHAPLIMAFASLYARHIALENDDLLPRARSSLTQDQLAALGVRMAQRRSVKI